MHDIILWSDAFKTGEYIPVRYSCDGKNISPPLYWKNTPDYTRSFSLIVDDPDSPTNFSHWIIFNIPPHIRGLPEGMGIQTTSITPWPFGDSSYQGINDFGITGYGGPCPPKGESHRYVFVIYALDIKLPLAPGSRKSDVERAMKDHILGKGELIGIYRRV